MVCEKCEKKLGTVITPDTWKDGARNTTESGGRKLNENKALTSKKARFDPYGKNKFAICRICKSSVHQPGSHYCQGCAYKKVPAENVSSLLTRSPLRTTGADVLKGPEGICLKSCQEAEGRAEWSILHVGIAGKDSFLNCSQRHF
ncbi:cysteine-rich PDZ-binding protein isoform X1 [Strigops habroptila]|uniref:cysteine-rich PDZ-binding protein isoform X1 n=1 Tax=Strigops habroptila TaxID=2489341 RepID=UPI0011CEE5D2|nr:cysteine-rich PDZ-binding protein isoform X1 [Strigops habroptila]